MGRPKKSVMSEDESFMEAVDETFAEAAGTPGNAHAKKLAKKASAVKKDSEPRGHFYMVKNQTKVVKVLVKAQGVYEVYVASLKRHKDQLDAAIKKWKKEGEWIEPHQYDEKILSIRKGL